MRSKFLFGALFCLSVFAFGQNPPVNQGSNQAAREQAFEARRQNFTTGRQLLLDKGVQFDPDELLRDEWPKEVKAALAAMPDMQQTRRETAPLKGAYLADTLYLPEKVQLSGHTIIVANYIVFEGKDVLIKGPYDIHILPTKPVTVLGTTLAEVLHKKPELFNVKFGGKPVLPSFRLLKEVVPTESHHIKLDTSGPEPEWVRNPPKPRKPNVRTVAWSGFTTAVLQSGNQNTSGQAGATGQNGGFGNAGTDGPNVPKGAPGTCPTSPNGANGDSSPQAGSGSPGGDGAVGDIGGNAGAINITVPDGDTNAYDYIANGGGGGQGGVGGDGGRGGNGGRGGDGGDGVACGCQVGNGGTAGHGGAGGQGADAGNGGNGGNGGAGGTITVSLPWNSLGPGRVFNVGGTGGPAGAGGIGGMGGSGGLAGNPGLGATACGLTGLTGDSNFAGNPAPGGKSGNGGTATGQNGPNGPTPSITNRPNPNAGGGGTGTCLGGSDPSGALGSDGSGGSVAPTCSPIIVDTEREGFHLTSPFNGVTFDISGTGHPVQIAWTDARFHNAFLALPGADGLVHNGKELFGNFTPQPQSAHPNGFLALAQYDKPENGGNGDGMIDDRDEVFSRLRLWIDENHDGICQPGELHRLPELGVYSLALNYDESRRTDQFGNQFRYKTRVNPGERRDPRDETSTGEPGRWTYDIFFVVK